jgi:hypothetical protein
MWGMTAVKKGTAMKDKKKRAGGGPPPPPPPWHQAEDVGLQTQDNVFGVSAGPLYSTQNGLSCASIGVMSIKDLNTNANVAPNTGTPLVVADYYATKVHSHTPTGFPNTPISGEVALNIANNGSQTKLDIGISVYNTVNARFGGGSSASLSLHHDALNLLTNGHLRLANNNYTNLAVLNLSPTQMVGQRIDAIVLDNPPAVATGQLILEARWGTIQSKRGSGHHRTDRYIGNSFTGSAYIGIVIT